MLPVQHYSAQHSQNKCLYPKAGIYFSHYECFGHTAITMAIGDVFRKRFPKGDLFFIQAGLFQPESRLDKLGKVYRLPGELANRQSFRNPSNAAVMDVDARGKMCGTILAQERPDLFITEYFPLGHEESRFELIPSLIKTASYGVKLWGVAGHPLMVGDLEGWRAKILKFYQRIIILSPPVEKELIAAAFVNRSDRQKYLDFFDRYASKITFAGYITPHQQVVSDDHKSSRTGSDASPDSCRVTVVRGGGAYYPRIIADAILASDLLGKQYHLTVVAGPSTTAQEWQFFLKLAGKKKIKNLMLIRSAGNYEQLIAQSDVCVSVASYHTSMILLKHHVKAVLIPFEGYGNMSFNEQPARAVMLKETLGAGIVPYAQLTAYSLTEKIQEMASSGKNKTRVPKEWFSGHQVLEKIFSGLRPGR